MLMGLDTFIRGRVSVWRVALRFIGEFQGRAKAGMRKRHVCMHACMCQAETSLSLCRNSIASRQQGLGVFF